MMRAARGITEGSYVRVFNDRGSIELRARVSDRARRGVVVALSVWWKKLTRDGKNANELTNSDTLTDLGRAPTFLRLPGRGAAGVRGVAGNAQPRVACRLPAGAP